MYRKYSKANFFVFVIAKPAPGLLAVEKFYKTTSRFFRQEGFEPEPLTELEREEDGSTSRREREEIPAALEAEQGCPAPLDAEQSGPTPQEAEQDGPAPQEVELICCKWAGCLAQLEDTHLLEPLNVSTVKRADYLYNCGGGGQWSSAVCHMVLFITFEFWPRVRARACTASLGA
jgi:hypothetical protein